MKYFLLIFALAAPLSFPQVGAVFQNCVKEVGKIDKKTECSFSKFKFDANLPHVQEYFECVLMRLEYFWKGKFNDDWCQKELQRKVGFNKQGEVSRVVKKCQSEHGSGINAYKHFMCLLKDNVTKGPFKKLMISKDEKFFKKSGC